MAAFALAAVVLIVIPGRSVLFTIGRSLAYGWRGKALSVLGNAIGTSPATALVALGVGQVIAESVVVLTAVKIAGALHLIHLGVQAIRHRHDHAVLPSSQMQAPSSARQLWQGVVVAVTNQDTHLLRRGPAPVRQPRQRFGALATHGPRLPSRPDRVVLRQCLGADRGYGTKVVRTQPTRLSQMSAGGGVMMIGLAGSWWPPATSTGA
ncbi:LysE family translocator [Desertihabitans brevis]|uniref:LysE family translocator n=1 Tax=Desertihabitans brevis TaxID=2268447 RepID=UPI0018F66433|nr:LysE family translocator [Desertihabitans brevis]